jgi:hypothetical protein
MEISRYSSKFVLMQDVAKEILNKCSGCMLAVSILGSVLSNTPKNEGAWKKVYAQFKYYASAKEYTPHDYNGTIFAAIDLSLDHDENKMFSKDLMWSVLQALSLFFFSMWEGPSSCVVKLAWKSMQPEGETEYFEAVVNSLIHKNLVDLVDGSADGLRLHDLVVEYVELKTPMDLFSILCDQEGELKQGMELLAIFLSIDGKQNIRNHVKVLLWRAGAVFHDFLLDNDFENDYLLSYLLDSDAENAILAVFQLYKATQQDAKALLHLMHGDQYQAMAAAKVLVCLMINVNAENLLVDGDIENFVRLCTNCLWYSYNNLFHVDWSYLMLEMANCRVFAKKMICHKPLLILLVERIQIDHCFLTYVQILMALIVYVQRIKNTRSEENLLERDKDVTREPMKWCVSHVVLCHGENSFRGIEVPFFEPKFFFECVRPLLQKHVQQKQAIITDRYISLPPNLICDIIRVLGCWVDITNGATHFVEYGCAELLFPLNVYLSDGMDIKDVMRVSCHKVIFESILSNGHISTLVSIFKHGTKEDVRSVPWILKCLAIGHEEVALQLITEVGVEKVAEAVDLWEAFPRGAMQELWLKHEGIAKGMILQGTICELLTRVIHQDSEVCMRVLSNLIRYHDDIVAEDLDAKGGLRLFLACYSMQPLNPTWIQLLRNMAQNKAFANKMVALGSIEMVADTLNHPMDFGHLISVVGLVRCLVEGFEDRLEILLSKICIRDLLAIHQRLSLQGILEFTFLPGAFVITRRIVMDLLASNHHKFQDFCILFNLAKSHEEIASLIANLIATNDKIMKELFSKCDYDMCVELLSAKFAISREKKIKNRQI